MPRKPAQPKKTFTLRIAAELYEEIRATAAREFRSMSREAEYRLRLGQKSAAIPDRRADDAA